MFSWWFNDGSIKMMQACGGHGFLVSAGFVSLIEKNWANAILEGENNVQLIQVARELLRSLDYVTRGETKKLTGSIKYFADMNKIASYNPPKEKSQWRLPKTYEKMFKKTVTHIVQKSGGSMMTWLGEGIAPKNVFDQKVALGLTKAAKVHTVMFTMKYFGEKVEQIEDLAIRNSLEKLVLIFGIDQLMEFADVCVKADAVDAEIQRITKEIYEELLEEISVDALSLVEGWGVPDVLLKSTIGHSNGKVYENLYEAAVKFGELNKMDVHPTMMQIIKGRNAALGDVANDKPKL